MLDNKHSIKRSLNKAIYITNNLEQIIYEIDEKDKLLYVSPEQTGRLNIQIDHRSTFYSLGVILFKHFTEQFPFTHNDDMQLIYAHIAIEAPSLGSIKTELPVMLSSVIKKLLNKNIEDRYQTLNAILYDLELILENSNKIFTIATKDILNNLKISNKTYGRDSQTKTIINRISKDKKDLIIIGGYSGIGKSTLIDNIKEKNNNNDIIG